MFYKRRVGKIIEDEKFPHDNFKPGVIIDERLLMSCGRNNKTNNTKIRKKN